MNSGRLDGLTRERVKSRLSRDGCVVDPESPVQADGGVTAASRQTDSRAALEEHPPHFVGHGSGTHTHGQRSFVSDC